MTNKDNDQTSSALSGLIPAGRVGGVVAVPGSGVPLGGYRWYTVGTVRAVGPWTVDSPVGALVGP